MKKHITKFLFLACLALASIGVRGQSNVCSYTTCVPTIAFNNSDLLQIYAAVLNGASSGTVIAGNVGGFTTKYTHTIQTDGLYASGDCVGGILTFTDVFRVGQVSGVLQDIEIWDNNNQNANLTIDFYAESPTGTFTDNAATVISDATNYLGTVQVSAGDYITTGTKSRATITGIGLTLRSKTGAASPRNFYATITTTSTPTYGAGNNFLYLKCGVFQD